MTSAPEPADELEELDICEKLSDLDTRMVAIGLALKGSSIEGEAFFALYRLVDDVRERLDELEETLKHQDAAKRARGEPRAARIFPGGAVDELGGP
jgi:hypothetical protein